MDYSTGTWWICFYAYTPFSGKITTLEKDFNGIVDLEDSMVLTQTIFKEEAEYGRYVNSNLNIRGRLHINIDTQEESANLIVRYRLCTDGVLSACILDKENNEHKGEEVDDR